MRSSVTKWALFNVVEKDELDTVRPSFPGAELARRVLAQEPDAHLFGGSH